MMAVRHISAAAHFTVPYADLHIIISASTIVPAVSQLLLLSVAPGGEVIVAVIRRTG